MPSKSMEESRRLVRQKIISGECCVTTIRIEERASKSFSKFSYTPNDNRRVSIPIFRGLDTSKSFKFNSHPDHSRPCLFAYLPGLPVRPAGGSVIPCSFVNGLF